MASRPAASGQGVRMAMSARPGAHFFEAMCQQLARAEQHYPDWETRLLRFHLSHARYFQLKCESHPRKHGELLKLPEYQTAARRVVTLKHEYHLWLSRHTAIGQTQSRAATSLIEHYLSTARHLRHQRLYVEHFSGHPGGVATLTVQGFQAHEVPYLGLGCPETWAYIDGQHQERQMLRQQVTEALERLGVPG